MQIESYCISGTFLSQREHTIQIHFLLRASALFQRPQNQWGIQQQQQVQVALSVWEGRLITPE